MSATGLAVALLLLHCARAGMQESLEPSDFRLLTGPEGFTLSYSLGDEILTIPVSRDWLIPPEAEREEEHAFVSSFNYEETVTAFAVGDGRIALHLSSYDIQREGSAQAATGRDVFLLLDPRSQQLWPGRLELGITKHRVRLMGCFSASHHTFLMGDVNADRLADIGVIREAIECRERRSGELDTIEGSFYSQGPIRWYVLSQDRWRYDPNHDRKLPNGYRELPLIGLSSSPVEFVKSLLKK